MLYALVSDIHANLTAWKAVLEDLTALKAEKIICLGDVVGYGPEPAATLESVYRHVDGFVMGNHDAVASGKMPPDSFNDHAKEMIRWSAGRLPPRAKHFLGQQPLTLDAPKFICAHGSLDHPQAFNYILAPDEALSTWAATDKQLVFIGHSHIPAIFVIGASGTPHLIDAQDFQLEEDKRYIVNVGSVGDPRDNDPRASYCLFDDSTDTVFFRRVPFDYETVQNATVRAGLDASTIPLLKRDPVAKREMVRESLGFAPPASESGMARDVAQTGTIGSLKKSNRRLRVAIFAAVTAFMAAAGSATALLLAPRHPSLLAFPETPLPIREAVTPSDLRQNLLPALPLAELGAGDLLPGWRYELADPKRQHIQVYRDAESQEIALEITNDDRLPFALIAPSWNLNGVANGRVRAIVKTFRQRDFIGSGTITVTADLDTLGETRLLTLPISLNRIGIWTETRRITENDNRKTHLTAETKTLSYRLDAEFSGKLHIKSLQLRYIPDDKTSLLPF